MNLLGIDFEDWYHPELIKKYHKHETFEPIVVNAIDKIIDPNAPAIVLFGLILVNLGPLNIFPKINPPISEAIQPNKKVKRTIFN